MHSLGSRIETCMATRTAPAAVLSFMRGGYRMRAKRDKQASNTDMSQIIIIIIINFLLGIVHSLLPVGKEKKA